MSKKILSVGIDVGSKKLDVCLWQQDSEIYKTFANGAEGINSLVAYLQEVKIKSQPIALEATGSYYWQSALCLSKQGFNLKIINPIITKKYQRSSIRNTKTDKVDAARLAQIGFLEKGLPTFLDSSKDLTNKQYQALLKKLLHLRQQTAATLRTTQSTSKSIGIVLDLEPIKQVLANVNEAIEKIKTFITQEACALAVDLAGKVQGLSLLQASLICNATVNREFKNRNQLVAFFGLDIKQNTSGTLQGRQSLSKRGNPFFRMILFQLGWSLKFHNPLYKQYYQRLIDNKKNYFTAILATARKFLRYYFMELKEYQKTQLLTV
jgi:transposase